MNLGSTRHIWLDRTNKHDSNKERAESRTHLRWFIAIHSRKRGQKGAFLTNRSLQVTTNVKTFGEKALLSMHHATDPH